LRKKERSKDLSEWKEIANRRIRISQTVDNKRKKQQPKRV